MRLTGVFILILAVVLSSPGAYAEWKDVIPKPFENGAYLDLFTSVERDNNRNAAQTFRWKDTFIKEKVTLYSNGYIYHPRFLLYDVSLAGALKQERYTATFLESSGWNRSSGVEYDTKLMFLPQHPYNLELFSQRYEPLFKEQSARRRNNVEKRSGVAFRYRQRPYFFHARYSADSIESGVLTTDTARVNVGGEYYKRFSDGNLWSVNAAYNPSRYTSTTGLDGSSSERLLSNTVDLKRVRFNLSLSENSFDQDDRLSRIFKNDQTALYGVLTAYFPGNLRSDVSYRHQDNDSTIREGVGPQTLDRSDTSEDLRVEILHWLYRSLQSRYILQHYDRSSPGGDSTTLSHLLNLNYTKSIPRGRILNGINVGRSGIDSEGAADVANEPHAATPVPGSLTLNQQNPEPQSILVFVRATVAPFQLVPLVENVHYTVTPISNTFQINLITLPPPFVVPGTFDVFVSYTLASGTFELRTDTVGYNASVELLDQLLTPYYSYVALRSEELSGVFPGIPIDSTTHTAGVLVYKGPLRARGEYQHLDWEVSPYRAWKVEVQGVGPLTPTTNIYATLSYVDKRYPEGTSLQLSEPYTESTTSASGNIQKRFPWRSMLLSAGYSFSRLRGLVDSEAYSLNSSMTWRVGKLDLALGASAYSSDTVGGGFGGNRRTNQYYYIKIRRQLF